MAMPFPGKMRGRRARDVAREAFSDHGIRRGVGIATINALADLASRRRPHPGAELRRGVDAFDANVFRPDDLTVVVGAFVPFLKELKKRGQKFLVLEKDPATLKESEMPFYRPAETAPEVIPQADVLLITGSTLLYHSMEDLLAMARPDTRVTLVGPTVGLLPDAFLARGADILGGVEITEPDEFLDLLAEGGSGYHFFGRVAERSWCNAAPPKPRPPNSTMTKHTAFTGRLVIIGFGSIGQGVLPLLLRHLDMKPEQVTIITAEERRREVAAEYGIEFVEHALTRENYREALAPRLSAGDFLLNVSVDVSSLALVEFCQERGALYLDTCTEPWPGGYTDPNLPPAARSNYARYERAPSPCAAKPRMARPPVITHGANPGLVSHFVKQALVDLAPDTAVPTDREGWARLSESLGIKAIHIAERDTQVAATPKEPGEFVNTWSIDGFFSEGSQPAELGWGTHERHFPADGHRHEAGSRAAIYLMRPGASTRQKLDAARRPLSRLADHPQRVDLDRRLSDRRHGCQRALPADLPLRLPPLRRRRAEPPRTRRQELGIADEEAPDRRRDHDRDRRIGRCC